MEVLYAVIDIFFVLQNWILDWIVLVLFAEWDCSIYELIQIYSYNNTGLVI